MYDGSKIIAGLIVFLALVTFPFWNNFGAKHWKEPELQLPPKSVATQCIESTQWMRDNHMKLLNDWRDSVVREGNRIYISKTDHKEYKMSLQNTCLKCHDDKEKFCDKCHTAASVSPYCWDCHVAPKPKGN
ncbi:cytochrome c family protein [Desulfovibrio sp. X2]|uniref:sulfate reduction electron transfer complex DsrMKJOP subunit DsrJ n=1 Tax=Desulfovibrio sp. X2 TaxID=941449 RepID=UPI000358CC72|nr:sulfate reduction electron transfer complex DsrMKJOP subunit DsrJ [Desulfovibrio sp. X2]EPR40246.1 cytochrome c family protein [Desulfovibrio sp. X2]